MGRPVYGRGFFSGKFKFDAINEGFEKVIFKACLKDGEEPSEAHVLKQTGYNKYLVINENKEIGVVMLVDPEAEDYEAVEGTAYVTVKDIENGEQHYVRKIMRNVIHTFDGLVLPYRYEISEDELEGKFSHEEPFGCYFDNTTTSTPDSVVEANKEGTVEDKAQEEKDKAEREAKEAAKEEASKASEPVVEEETPSEEVVEEPKTEETPSEEVVEETPSEEVTE